MPPTISGYSPAGGPVGTVVTITGTNLASASVTFNGTAATLTSNTATQIVVPVPTGATTGQIIDPWYLRFNDSEQPEALQE